LQGIRTLQTKGLIRKMKNLESIPFCKECVVDLETMFTSLKAEELDQLGFEKGCDFYKRGDIVYHEGNRMSGCYCVNKGVIKLYKTGIEGKEQIIAFAKKGDLIGFRSVLSGELACTTGKVIDDAVLCFIPAETLFALVKSNPEFSMQLMQLTCKELGEANQFITDIAQKTVRERLAEVLIMLMESFGLDESFTLQISLTREELANIVGTATESVIRLLSEFKGDKLIELNGRKIKILDSKTLRKVGNVY
jgi:CRP/FNR family transcriptional regulator, polysaccharide utilization system transcription regulator